MEGKRRRTQRLADHRRQMFRRTLSRHRRDFGYTQAHLAALVEESPQTISKLEHGTMVPSFDKLFQLADVFATTVDAMAGGGQARAGTTTYIDAVFSASDGSMLFIGTQDLDALGKAVDLFVRVRHKDAAQDREPPPGA